MTAGYETQQPAGRVSRALAGALEAILAEDEQRLAAEEGRNSLSPSTGKTFLATPPPFATDDDSLSHSATTTRPAPMNRRHSTPAASTVTATGATRAERQPHSSLPEPELEVDAAVAAWVASPESSEAAASLAALVSPEHRSGDAQPPAPLRRRLSSTGPDDPVRAFVVAPPSTRTYPPTHPLNL